MKATHKERALLWCSTSRLSSQQDCPPGAPLEETKGAFIPHEPTTIPHSVPSMATLLHAAPREGECSPLAGTAGNSRIPIVLNALPNVLVCDNPCGRAGGNEASYQRRPACRTATFLEDNTRNVTEPTSWKAPPNHCRMACCLFERNSILTSKAQKKQVGGASGIITV